MNVDDDENKGGKKGDEKRSPKRGRPPKRMPPNELETRVKESLTEVADWLDRDGAKVEVSSLADLLRRDAESMAEVITAWAQKVSVVAVLAERIFGKAGPLSALRAFGPTVRHALGDALERRRLALDELERERVAAAAAGGDDVTPPAV